MIARSLVLAALIVFLPSQVLAQFVIPGCSYAGVDAVLAANLDCSNEPGFAFTLRPGGRLDLAGHTLTGAKGGGVYCESSCVITGGGGAIAGSGGHGVEGPAGSRIAVLNTVIRNHAFSGVTGKKVTVRDSVIRDNGQYGILGQTIVIVSNSQIVRNMAGVMLAGFADHFFLPVHDRLKISGSTIADNDTWGISASSLSLKSSTVSGHAFGGIYARRLTASSSDITGNVPDASCADPFSCTDIAVLSRPLLRLTSCDTSLRLGPPTDFNSTGTDWNVCAEDD